MFAFYAAGIAWKHEHTVRLMPLPIRVLCGQLPYCIHATHLSYSLASEPACHQVSSKTNTAAPYCRFPYKDKYVWGMIPQSVGLPRQSSQFCIISMDIQPPLLKKATLSRYIFANFMCCGAIFPRRQIHQIDLLSMARGKEL